MTDPRNPDGSYPPFYWSRDAPLGATAHNAGQQAAYGQASQSPPRPPPSQKYSPGMAQYQGLHYVRSTEHGVFDMSPIPGEMPSPYYPPSAQPTPPTQSQPGQARPSPNPNSPPVLRAPDRHNLPPSYSPPEYASPGQGTWCSKCRRLVSPELAGVHFENHRIQRAQEQQQQQQQQQHQTDPHAPRPAIGLGYGHNPSFFTRRGDDQDQGGSGSAESSGSGFYNSSSQTSARRY